MTCSKITPFLFDGEITVRVVERDGAFWFVATDVCRALGLANPTETVRSLDEDERGLSTTETSAGSREAVVVSESGVFKMIFKSRKPDAAKFRKWVTSEVLPSIRATGRYMGAAATEPVSLPEALWLRIIMEARQTFGARVAAELWLVSGLPVVVGMRQHLLQSDLFAPWTSLERGTSLTSQ